MCSQTIVALLIAEHCRVSLAAARFDWRCCSLARIFSRPPRLELDGEPTGIASDFRVTPVTSLSQRNLLLGCE